jgi:hypothetical protein
MQHSDHPLVSNDEYRVTGKQPTLPIADPDNPILQPWAREALLERNERVLGGKLPIRCTRAAIRSASPIFSSFR